MSGFSGRATGLNPLDSWLTDLLLEDPALPSVRSLFNQLADVVAVLDLDARVQYLSRVRPPWRVERILGRQIYDFSPDEDAARARECIQLVRSSGKPAYCSCAFVDPGSGQRSLLEARVTPLRLSGNLEGFLVSAREVTPSVAVSGEHNLLSGVLPEVLWVAGPEGRLSLVSSALARTLGFTEQDMLERPMAEFVHPDDRRLTEDAHRTLMGGAEFVEFENRYVTNIAEYRTLSWRAFRGTQGELLIGIAKDVTEQRAAEEQLRDARKMGAVGQLARGLAHDINNLLMSIMVNADVAAEIAVDNAELLKHLDEVQRASGRAAERVRKLVSFSRKSPAQIVPFNFNDVISELLKMLGRLIPETVEVSFVPAQAQPTLFGDPSQLEQVMHDLCVNAFEAMTKGGRLTIETEVVLLNRRSSEAQPWMNPGRYALITVSDSGCGMTSEVKERVFEPFFTTKEARKGAGLGLANARAVVEQHQGLLRVDSEPTRGSSFELYLPLESTRASGVTTV